MNRHRPLPLSVLVLAAAIACERDKQDADTTTSATTEVDETSSTGSTTIGTTDTGILDATESEQSASSTGESGTTGSEPLGECSARLTKEACHVDHHPQGLGYEFCVWVDIVTWDANMACPDLATGEGTCIQQDFTDDCSYNPACTHQRIFARLVASDIYEAFIHPLPCGDPEDYRLCMSDDIDIEPVCNCFGCG